MLASPVRRRVPVAARSAFTLLEVLVVVAILVVLAGVASIYVFRYLEDAKVDRARLDCRAIGEACETYRIKNGGEPPASLEQLVVPPGGGSPFLKNGAQALIDPWGNQYRMEVVPAGVGNEVKVRVFTVAPSGTEVSN